MKFVVPVPVRQFWKPDDGLKKCWILNKAIVAAQRDDLTFTDADCTPRVDFLKTHLREARKDVLLSDSYFKLPMYISHAISQADTLSQRAFEARWLSTVRLAASHKDWQLKAKVWVSVLFNTSSSTHKTWHGNHFSCAKRHAVAVNGFDERMQSGGEDCEFGDRLKHFGLRAKCIRFSTVCIHLDHDC